MMAILCIMTLGVFFRYVLNNSLSWSEELSRYGLIYATFIGAAFACKRGTHIRVAVLDELVPEGWRRGLKILQEGITLLLLIYLTYLAVRITGVLHGTKSTAMLLPMSLIYVAVVIGFGLSVVRLVIVLYRDLRS
jgi:TRAP-type C4-dicarboxylate transport system permease small subunit